LKKKSAEGPPGKGAGGSTILTWWNGRNPKPKAPKLERDEPYRLARSLRACEREENLNDRGTPRKGRDLERRKRKRHVSRFPSPNAERETTHRLAVLSDKVYKSPYEEARSDFKKSFL